ncbi:DUF6289 family protein [Sorangium sp. So ce260]|uniref:DUF6289 family protein n=1 Tax=Sorangium sp. So ce260 TaxID=3133291 RepID=UPI003F5FC2B0
MLKNILIALGLATSLAACMAEPSESASEAEAAAGEEAVDTAEQPLMSTGFNRTYYSDSSFKIAIGTETRDCDPDYNESFGEASRYYKTYRYNCPGSSMPGLPSTNCYICYDNAPPGGPPSVACVGSSCPAF